MLIEPTPELVTDVLRGDRARRPRRDDDAAAGLRALLEDHAFDVVGHRPLTDPLTISSAHLNAGGSPAEATTSPLGRARGVLVSMAFRLLVAQVHVADPYEDAMIAWRSEHPHDELLEGLAHLDEDQRARLKADVTSHVTTLTRVLGTIPSGWRPRTSQRVRQSFAGARVCLRDVIDLVVGSTHLDVANVALLDITTSPLGAGAERTMRYHALMQTLRSSVVPLRTSILSSATGELWTLDVDHELLIRSVDDVAAVLGRQSS
jgi:hypothetical protein